ncbi:MAG: ABC transporter permease [Acidobacteriia bacterium]|nr:ABC transporter permease [Terriglobia bacterium]
MRELLRRAWYFLRQRRLDDELAEEMEFHRAMTQCEIENRGVESTEASLAVRRAFGSSALARNQARDVWIWPWLQDVAQDVRFAARLLAKDRRFTLAAVVALALGIAANNTVFTFINAALIRDLPFHKPNQLMSIGSLDARGRARGVSSLDFQDWRRGARAFQGIAAHAGSAMNLSDEGRAPDRFRGVYISANGFDLLRATPILGRSFVADDERPGAPAVVILSSSVWKSRYGGDPSLIRRTVRVNDMPSIVIGVMPPGFSFPGTAEVWQPLTLLAGVTTARRDARTLSAFGRLREAVTVQQARADLGAIAEAIAREYPETNRGVTPSVAPLLEAYRRLTTPILMTLMGAVGFVLLIACANVANLLLARAAHRSREIAIRASLGATRWRIVRQLLIESLLLAMLAGAIGLMLSVYGVRYFGVAFDAMEQGAPDRAATPYWINLGMNGTVFAFVAALCLGSSILFGLAPALHISRTDVNDVLKASGRSAAGNLRARRWTGALMVAELALSVVLLAEAGLFVRSFLTLYTTNLVIDASHLSTARLALPLQKYRTPEARKAFFERLDERLATNPALTAVTVASDIPFASLGGSLRQVTIDGRPGTPGESQPDVSYVYVGGRYFDTLGLRLLQGRALVNTDGLAGQEGAVVNQRFAAMFFPHEDALGRRIRIASPGGAAPSPTPLTIVGIAPTLPQFGPRELAAVPAVYVPVGAEPAPGRFVSIVVRGPGLAAATALLREDVGALDPDLPLYSIQTTDDIVAAMRFPNRLMGSLLGLLALIALVLASVGLFALTAHSVTQRTQEIGVRMALGAQTSQVVWLLMWRTIVQLAVGLAIGLTGALAVGQLLQTFLVGTGARDPLTLTAVAALLIVVSLAASFFPARRAARVDPVVALRYE